MTLRKKPSNPFIAFAYGILSSSRDFHQTILLKAFSKNTINIINFDKISGKFTYISLSNTELNFHVYKSFLKLNCRNKNVRYSRGAKDTNKSGYIRSYKCKMCVLLFFFNNMYF